MSSGEATPAYKHLGRLYDRAELATLPKPEPLIAGWLDLRTSVVLIGATGTNKTFTALGWACSVATGRPWLGHEVAVTPCPVIYVVGEGAFGLDSRIAAWEEEHAEKVPGEALKVSMLPTSLTEDDFWTGLESLAGALGSRLVIFDTFSSLAPDADETKDAAAVIRRMSNLSVQLNGTAVLVHHTGWGPQDRARGGSQIEANPDSTIVLKKHEADDPDSAVSIYRKKNKEGPAGATLWVEREPVLDSCVLRRVGEPHAVSPLRSSTPSPKLHEAILEWLDEHPDEAGKSEALKAIKPTVTARTERLREAWGELVSGRVIRSRPFEYTDATGRKQTREVWARATPEEAKVRLRGAGR